MTLLELTMVIGISVFLLLAGATQINNQLEIVKRYKQVEYYAQDVPRAITAIQGLARGAQHFSIAQLEAGEINQAEINYEGGGVPKDLRTDVNSYIGRGGGVGTIGAPPGNALYIIQSVARDGEDDTTAGQIQGRRFYEIRPFLRRGYNFASGAGDLGMVGTNVPAAADRLQSRATRTVDLPRNIYDLCVVPVMESGSPGSSGDLGWVAMKGIADVTFQYIPGTEGAVMMQVWRQFRADRDADLAFELVLEAR